MTLQCIRGNSATLHDYNSKGSVPHITVFHQLSQLNAIYSNLQIDANQSVTPIYIGIILRTPTQNVSHIYGRSCVKIAYPYTEMYASIYRNSFAQGYAKFLPYIQEEFCVPYAKFLPYIQEEFCVPYTKFLPYIQEEFCIPYAKFLPYIQEEFCIPLRKTSITLFLEMYNVYVWRGSATSHCDGQ